MTDGPQPKQATSATLPFRYKLLAYGGMLALVPLVLLGIRSLLVTREGVTTLARELELAVASDVARTVDEQLRAAEDALELVGRTLTDRELGEDDAIAHSLRLVASLSALDHVGIYDDRGVFLDAIRESSLDAHRLPESLAPELREAANRAGSAARDPRGDEEGVRLLVVVPMRVDGVVTGYAASRISLVPLEEKVTKLAEVRFHGVENALLVVDGNGTILAHTNPDRLGTQLSIPIRDFLTALHLGPTDAQTSGEYERNGETWLATAVRVGGRECWVVAQEPTSRAYSTYFSLREFVLGTAFGAALLALFSAYIASKRITRPIEALAEFAHQLPRRTYTGPLTLGTRDELELLGHAMSEAARELEEGDKKLREESMIRSDLGRYLPAELVERVVKREHDVGLGGSRREITVLFADVVSFTPLTEKLDAEAVVALLNELFTLLTEIVFRHGGTIDKFIGDCVMALWGAADHDPDHALRAVRAAEDMIAFLETTNASLKLRYGVTIELAIGINSGECVVGNIGSETRMEYTAIGDVVNVAARLESIARPHQILVTNATRALVGDRANFVERGERELPGRARPVTLFEVLP